MLVNQNNLISPHFQSFHQNLNIKNDQPETKLSNSIVMLLSTI